MNAKFRLMPAGVFSCLFLLSSWLILTGCGAVEKETYPTPEAYDLNHPFKIELHSNLDEISGIDYYAKDTSVFAISDATGLLYKISLSNPGNYQKWKFERNDDYEDLKLVDSTFYILSSSGDMVTVKFVENGLLQVNSLQFNGSKGNEFESMLYDEGKNRLLMICKDCGADKKSAASILSLTVRDSVFTLYSDAIDIKPIAEKAGFEKIKFKPSATAVNPLTNEIYMISAVNKMLVIADSAGRAKEVYKLNPSLYKQPEGMSFTPAGHLLISNESAEDGPANILVFKLKIQPK